MHSGIDQRLSALRLGDDAIDAASIAEDDTGLSGIAKNQYQTLDDAAWQHFQRSPVKFPEVRRAISKIAMLYKNEQKRHKVNEKDFNHLLKSLYEAAPGHIDFVATTRTRLSYTTPRAIRHHITEGKEQVFPRDLCICVSAGPELV